MEQREVSRRRLDLKDNPKLLSPPVVREPLYQCATAVTVLAFVPHAKLEVQVDGSPVASVVAGFPQPDGATLALPNELVAGQKVRARQKTATATSGWSAVVVVRDHTQDYPAGPPRPQVNPAPVFRCGVRTGVGNLLVGGNVWITADAVEVGRVNGCQAQQGVNVSPAYSLGQRVRAWFELCKDPSPPSLEHISQTPPAPLPALGFDPIYAGGEQLRIVNVVNGARVTLYRAGVNQGTSPCWGGALLWGLSPAFSSGEALSATQEMCPGDPSSPPGTVTVLPCSSLPAPLLGPIQAGDDRVTLTQFVPDAVIRVYVNLGHAGTASGPVVLLNTKLKLGDTVHVVQDLAGCKGSTARTVRVGCVDAPYTYDPSALDLFPVGRDDYAVGSLKGTVYYPAEDDGASTAFNQRLAKVGRVPIVFLAHGNHYTLRKRGADPSTDLLGAFWERCPGGPGVTNLADWDEIPNHKGYDYFQAALARMGVISVSIDCNATNCIGYGAANIEDRADLIIDTITHFQTLDADPASRFHEQIDFARVGLMGHSRGGDAVVLVPEVIGLAGVTIRAVLSLAPTNMGASSGKPTGLAFMTLLPAGDGDVTGNNGAQFYDQAVPGPLKSQLYVHYTNHNFFNRQWPGDDSLTDPLNPPVISRPDHERVLLVYGCAFFRATLLGHAAAVRFLSGHEKPLGVLADHIHLSFAQTKALTVDNHEDGNAIGTNSLGLPTSQSGGAAADEFAFRQGGGSFNASFFGNSIGMVVRAGGANRTFRSAVKSFDLTKAEIWIRVAEVFAGGQPGVATGFRLGLEDAAGVRTWVDSDNVGGLPRPYFRHPSLTKTMLKTLRFKGGCFVSANSKFRAGKIVAILIQCNRKDERALAFDDLQIVKT